MGNLYPKPGIHEHPVGLSQATGPDTLPDIWPDTRSVHLAGLSGPNKLKIRTRKMVSRSLIASMLILIVAFLKLKMLILESRLKP